LQGKKFWSKFQMTLEKTHKKARPKTHALTKSPAIKWTLDLRSSATVEKRQMLNSFARNFRRVSCGAHCEEKAGKIFVIYADPHRLRCCFLALLFSDSLSLSLPLSHWRSPDALCWASCERQRG
jgi:hypothetical protein